MATAGTITIDFAAETSRFTAELKKVRGDLKSLKSDTASISGTLGTAALAVKAFIGGWVVKEAVQGIRAIISATEESEAAIAQLNSALKNAGGSAGLSSAQFQEFAAQMQRTSTFTDEAVIGVESILLSFKGLAGPVIKEATQQVLNLSARLGIDLTAAAKLLGRALVDPAKGMTALSRAGVVFSTTQKHVIADLVKTGDVAGAQALILKELESRVGGAAAAARDTLGGALKGLHNDFNDLLEAKGGMPGATSAINEFAKVLQSEEMKHGFAAMIAGLASLVEWGAKAATAIATFIKPDAFLTHSQIIGKELDAERRKLETLEDSWKRQQGLGLGLAQNMQPAIEAARAHVAELTKEIALAKEAEGLSKLSGGHGAIIAAEFVDPNADAKAAAAEAAVVAATALKKADAKEFADFMVQINSDMYTELASQTLAAQEVDAGVIQAGQEARLAAIQNEEDLKLDIRRQAAEEEMAIFEGQRDRLIVVEQQKIAAQQATISAGIGLLQVWAQKSKAAAIALIVVNRGLQIAQAIQNTHAAAVNALANVPYPYNLAASAQMLTMGYIQVGLIAATGALEIAGGTGGAGGGGSAVRPGSPANPLPVTPVSPGSLEEQKAVQVFINGVVTETVIQQLMDAMDDKFESGVVIIGHGTDQADAIRRGG